MQNLKWTEFQSDKIRTFQLGDFPEIIYVVEIRSSEYMIILEDAYDLKTGEIEFLTSKELKSEYGII